MLLDFPKYGVPSIKYFVLTSQSIRIFKPNLFGFDGRYFLKGQRPKHVAVTTDMWRSDSGLAYLAVTVHFVHESRLQSSTLSTMEMPKEHNSENIADALKSETFEWGIYDKIVACVADNDSTMKKTIADILKGNIYCIAHTLNLAVKDCIEPKLTVIESSNEAKVINDLLRKRRSLVGHSNTVLNRHTNSKKRKSKWVYHS